MTTTDLEKYCDLYINDVKMLFCWKYKFEKEGKYEIKIKLNQLLNSIIECLVNVPL